MTTTPTGHPVLAAMHTVTGAPALVIILVLLALLVFGVISLIRFIARRARN